MQKRKFVSLGSSSGSKIQKMTGFDQEIDENSDFNLPYLPVEIITKIITNLTDIVDIKNCMKLSKDVNSFMFKTPEIISKFKFNLDCIAEPKASNLFITIKGRHVKSMTVAFNSNGSEILRTFLSQMPKLEEFVFENREPVPDCEQQELNLENFWPPIDLPELKVLKIDLRNLKAFIKSTKTVKTLEKLTIFVSTSNDQHIMTDFILQQDNLKELNLKVTKFGLKFKFPTKNIQNDVKFKLQTLKILTNQQQIVNLFTDQFLVTQANCLEELEFDSSPSDRTIATIFYRFKKLRKFTQKTDEMSMMIQNIRYLVRKLKHVTHYEDMNTSGINLRGLFQLLPNLTSLKCIFLNNSVGCFPTVHDLDVNNLKIFNLKNIRMENLKKLTIKKLMDIQEEEDWLKYVETISNLDSLTIKGIEFIGDLLIVLKNLKCFKKLQKFSFLHNPGINRGNIMNDNETVPRGYRFYKIVIDMSEKTVGTSTYITKKNRFIMSILIQNFRDFEFFEI